jgi:ribosomal protein S18 acetylase RimI-like enzyme
MLQDVGALKNQAPQFKKSKKMKITIRRMIEGDVASVGEVHRRTFPRQRDSENWIACNLRAYPRMQYFVALVDSEIVGFIHWTQKSGFRAEAVLELEQIAVIAEKRNLGVGRKLIEASIPMVNAQLDESGAKIRHIMVTTRADNYAQKLYRKRLGAEVECTITDLYSADEVIMMARNVEALEK